MAKVNHEMLQRGDDCAVVLIHRDSDEALDNNKLYGYLDDCRYNTEKEELVVDLDVIKGKEKDFRSGRFRNFSMRRNKKNDELINLAIVSRGAIPSAKLINAEIEELSAQYGEVDSVDFSLERGLEMIEDEMNENTEDSFSVEKNIFQKFFDEVKGFFTNQDKSIKEISSALEEFKKPEKVNEEEDMTEDFAALQAKIVESEKKLKEYEDYKAQVELKEKTAIEDRRKEEATNLYDEFSKKGLVLPCQEALAKKLLLSENAEDFKAFLALNKPVDFDVPSDVFSAPIPEKIEELDKEAEARINATVHNF